MKDNYINDTTPSMTVTKRHYNNFVNKKKQCLLYKNDKSSIGNIDPIVVPICTILNDNFDNNYYTTSSCSGRSYIYTGIGNKSSSTIATSKIIIPKSTTTDTTDTTEIEKTNQQQQQQQQETVENDEEDAENNEEEEDEEHDDKGKPTTTTTTTKNKSIITESTFVRCRVLHDCIDNPIEYFNLYTLEDEYQKQIHTILHNTSTSVDDTTNTTSNENSGDATVNIQQNNTTTTTTTTTSSTTTTNTIIHRQWWLRYEPFILHVSCCTIEYAQNLLSIARIAGYKTVGITTIDIMKHKYIVSIHGDEGLDMPLTSSCTTTDDDTSSIVSLVSDALVSPIQLQEFVNTRHIRNWNKMDRFLKELQRFSIQNDNNSNINYYSIDNDNDSEDNSTGSVEEDNDIDNHYTTATSMNHSKNNNKVPSFDVIGDVAILNTISNTGIPVMGDADTTTDSNNNNNGTNLNSIQNSVSDYEKDIGQRILNKNNNIQWVVVRSSTLHGSNRSGSVRLITCRQRHQKIFKQKKDKQQLSDSTATTTITTTIVDDQVQDNSQPQQQEKQEQQQQVQQLPDPFITTHKEHGISCVIDIQRTFFSVRMAPERTRLWNVIEKVDQQQQQQQLINTTSTTTADNNHNNNKNNNHILVVFAGVGLEAFLLVSKIPSIQSITVIEQNTYAIQCIYASIRMLRRNKAVSIGGEIVANKISVIEGDVNEIIPNKQLLQRRLFQRIIAPRPKNSKKSDTITTTNDHDEDDNNDEDEDGDLGTGTHGSEYLQSLLSILDIPTIIVNNNNNNSSQDDDVESKVPDHITTSTTGIIHWYDFVSEIEYKTQPINCIRSRTFLQNQIQLYDTTCSMHVLTIVKAGSTVAKRQLRVCIDFIVYREVNGANQIVI